MLGRCAFERLREILGGLYPNILLRSSSAEEARRPEPPEPDVENEHEAMLEDVRLGG